MEVLTAILLVLFIVQIGESVKANDCQDNVTHIEVEPTPQDGWFNNLVHPDWGAIDTQLIRKALPKYSDGVYHMAGRDRPNPFLISRAAHKGEPGLGSERGRNAMLVFFGQQIVEEIIDAQRPGCPREFENIPVPKDFPEFDPQGKGNLFMPFQRSRYDQRTGLSPNNPRQQLNEITPYIDGTLFYGPARAWTDAIREFNEEKPGRLKTVDINKPIQESFPAYNDIRLPFANPPPPRDHYLKPVSRFYRLGNPRGFENPFLLAFGVLFFRWHNHIADTIAKQNSSWNDEQVFEKTRKFVIAHHQKIVMYDWLPLWLQISEDNRTASIPAYKRNNVENFNPFNGYNPEIHPGIAQEFQTAAMRFGHTLVTPGVWLRGALKGTKDPSSQSDCNWKSIKISVPGSNVKETHGVRLCNAYWNSQESVENDLDAIIRGLTSTLAEKEDHILVPDLREHLFGPLEFSRRDLAALNIQRARDHGIPDYNTVRSAYGLPRLTSWDEINNDPKMRDGPISSLRALYKNSTTPDDVDLFTGGMLETTLDGPGPLFRAIILEQFMRIRHGDRFWFENEDERLRTFTDEEIKEIKNVTLRDIILAVTNIAPEEIPQNVFRWLNTKQQQPADPCEQPEQLKADVETTLPSSGIVLIENCTQIQYYDYFYGSQVSFALSFAALALCVPVTVGIMICMAKRRQAKILAARRVQGKVRQKSEANTFTAVEWVGPKSGERRVKIQFDTSRKKIHVKEIRGRPLRMIDLRHAGSSRVHMRKSNDGAHNLLSIRVQGEIDLLLRFGDQEERETFIKQIEGFLQDLGINRDKHSFTEKTIISDAETKDHRQQILDKFFRISCMQAFEKTSKDVGLGKLDSKTQNLIQRVKLTRTEFADAFGLKPNSIFVRNMFLLGDRDNDGFIGFKEFQDLFAVLASGEAEDKALMIFNMYDIRQRGYLSQREFEDMIKSMLDLSDTTLQDSELKELIRAMYNVAGVAEGQNLDFDNFKKIFNSDEYENVLSEASLGLDIVSGIDNKSSGRNVQDRRKTFIKSYKDGTATLQRTKSRITIKITAEEYPMGAIAQKWYDISKYFETNRLRIFWATLYTLVTIGIFVERAYYYSIEREHAGLRRIAGYGVTVTRGAASVMMWTYSCLLVTMSRNTITFLRETFFHRFIPFDAAIDFHKYIAYLALGATLTHCVGHGINLYHICTQASSDLNCVFREYFRATDVLASFHYWAYQTITGLTGVILTIIVIVMYVFALPYARKNLFGAFWFTHRWYILLYIFSILHGLGQLVQQPLFGYYFIGPCLLFVLDQLVSLSRNKLEIAVVKAELLPSEVTALTFKRPPNFEYRSGQWVRIACTELGEGEYHPFTLSSAPHEDHLSLHIRAVGPWTTNLRRVYDPNNLDGKAPPRVLIDGPFGEGHQDWYKFPVAVLVGGGIGVTPFASILKDIVHRAKYNIRFACQKVYFLWITRTQKQFEWLTDIIKQVENADEQNFVTVHIFITQFKQKFDLRTTMLWMCERHFHKIAGKSLFTGLRSTTHFGRPRLVDFLQSLKYEHPQAQHIGVFSCGPAPMTLSVNDACSIVNKYEGYPQYSHHFENF